MPPFPDPLRLHAVPLSLTLRCQGWRLPASRVAHGIGHPRPGSRAAHFPRLCAGALLLPPSQGCPPHCLTPHRRERGGSSAERMRACGRTREAPAPSAGRGGEWRSPRKRRICGGHSPPLQGRGCEHDPARRPACTTPARPTFGCHPAHAVPHAGQRAPGTRRWGMQGSCTRDGTRGRAHTQWGRGAASL